MTFPGVVPLPVFETSSNCSTSPYRSVPVSPSLNAPAAWSPPSVSVYPFVPDPLPSVPPVSVRVHVPPPVVVWAYVCCALLPVSVEV